MVRRNKPTIDDELIDKLLEGREHSAALLGNDGLIGELKKRQCLSLEISGFDSCQDGLRVSFEVVQN